MRGEGFTMWKWSTTGNSPEEHGGAGQVITLSGFEVWVFLFGLYDLPRSDEEPYPWKGCVSAYGGVRNGKRC